MANDKTKRFRITTTNGTFYCEGLTIKSFKDDETGETFLAIVNKIYKDNDFHANIIFNIKHFVCWEDISEEE